MNHCKHLGTLELPVLLPEDLSLVQRSEEVDRAKYKYTEWLKETAPGTPLDVSKPHAVLMTDAMERSAISISFRRVRYPELITYFQ